MSERSEAGPTPQVLVTGLAASPMLPGLVRADLRKLWYQPLTWLLLAAALALVGAFALGMGIGNGPGHEKLVSGDPVDAFAGVVDTMGFALQLALGIVFLPLSAWLVTMEFANGTVHTLLARGVGRVQLYVAKLCALTAFGFISLTVFMVGLAAYTVAAIAILSGGLGKFQTLPDWSWHNVLVLIGVQAVSLLTAILLGMATGAIGRASTAFGVTAAMTFFPADNFALFVLRLIGHATGADWSQKVTNYFLGPNLNHLRNALEANHKPIIIFLEPLDQNLGGLHSLSVVAGWCLLFIVLPVVLLRVRDVQA